VFSHKKRGASSGSLYGFPQLLMQKEPFFIFYKPKTTQQ